MPSPLWLALRRSLLVAGLFAALPAMLTPRRAVSAPGASRTDGIGRAEIGGGGAWVVYAAPGETAGANDLFRVPIGGGSEPVRIGGPLASPLGEQWTLSRDGERVVYLAHELYSAPVDGHTAATSL